MIHSLSFFISALIYAGVECRGGNEKKIFSSFPFLSPNKYTELSRSYLDNVSFWFFILYYFTEVVVSSAESCWLQ